MTHLSQDLRYAVRSLARQPGFTVVAVVTLALAIGANTAIFSAVDALLLNPYPFPHSDRLVLLDARHSSGKNSGAGYRDFLDWQAQNSVFADMAIVPETSHYTLTGVGAPRRLVGGATTADFLNVLQIQPARGRFFSASEDQPGAPRVLLLTYAAWQGDLSNRPFAVRF
jgi:putative ABC transport system permease protein